MWEILTEAAARPCEGYYLIKMIGDLSCKCRSPLAFSKFSKINVSQLQTTLGTDSGAMLDW